jgi:hypothetical protein
VNAREAAIRDQLDAAAREATHHLRTVAAAIGSTFSTAVPDWLRPHIDTLRHAIDTRTDTGCPHRWSGAQILAAAVWAPGVITCGPCHPLLKPSPGEDHICDRCNRYVRHLLNGTVQYGPILLNFGICHACHTPEQATPTTRTEAHR